VAQLDVEPAAVGSDKLDRREAKLSAAVGRRAAESVGESDRFDHLDSSARQGDLEAAARSRDPAPGETCKEGDIACRIAADGDDARDAGHAVAMDRQLPAPAGRRVDPLAGEEEGGTSPRRRGE